ncbi:uncharacterized protein KRP23_7574 [Phytophthora ramorum]|uniref:uncharacterized protein n=1 Tax=Phytophthora ramorum TaxID=164328 RepID=UPI0030AD482B|nr:hypothetical protein KRP23_7574 [Phytophthora ramorum]
MTRTAATWAKTLAGQQERRMCVACGRALASRGFSRHQLAKPSSKCRACVEQANVKTDTQPRLKRCVQCFQSLPKTSFSKRQAQLLDAKCRDCVQELNRAAAASPAHVASKWSFDHYYRVCHRGKSGGVSVRVKHNIASPLLGYIPLGRVFRATAPICNEQGDPMVRLEGPYLPSVVVRDGTKTGRLPQATEPTCNELSDSKVEQEDPTVYLEEPHDDKAADASKEEDEVEKQIKEAWVCCRSIRNEVLLESHEGPFGSGDENLSRRFFRCVVEGCKVRERADLEISELGYVLYGDVVEVVEATVAPGGVVFLRLHGRYFDGPAWVVERSLDNESVLNEVEGPWSSSTLAPRKEKYRCVQDSGAPVRLEPELTAAPVGRIPCGGAVTVVERAITDQRQVFLRIADFDATHVGDQGAGGDKWVIETSTCCASVMIKTKFE